MTEQGTSRRRLALALCLVVLVLLCTQLVRQARPLLANLDTEVPLLDALLLSLLLGSAAGVLVLAQRVRTPGVPRPVLASLCAAGAGLALVVATPALARADLGADFVLPGGTGGSAYRSELVLSFLPSLHEREAALVVLLLGLLPVAGLVALQPARTVLLPRPTRIAVLLAAVLTAVVVTRYLARSLALPDLLRGLGQEYTVKHVATTVAALWSLVALLLCWRAVRGGSGRALAVSLPFLLLLGWSAQLLREPPRHVCCLTYSAGPYEQPSVVPDLGLLAIALLIGLLPLAIGQLRRVRTSPSTPPG